MELWPESRVKKQKCERQVNEFPQSAKLSRAVPVGSVRNDKGTRDAENARPRDPVSHRSSLFNSVWPEGKIFSTALSTEFA